MGQMVEIFGKENYFVELHNHGIEEQIKLVPKLLKLAKKFDLKTVASVAFITSRVRIGLHTIPCFVSRRAPNSMTRKG